MTASTFARMSGSLAARRFLIVDDERSVATTLARRLEQEGALCTVVHDGHEALAQLASGAFDVLITDLEMPGRSGYDLIDEAKRLADPPAILLLADGADPAGAAIALSRGADSWLRKPVHADLVMHEALTALELRRLQKMVEGLALGPVGPVLAIVGEIVNAFEKADPYRAGYSTRTARIAVAMAEPLGLDPERLAVAGRVHDVGMLAVPVTEQHADGPPNRASQHLIRVHPTLGARWVERLGADRAIVAAVAAHHERFDGSGYPGGLAGDDIPPLARALGTAAAVAAMSAERPWREKRESVDVLAQLEAGRGKQFGVAEADAVIDILLKNPGLVG